MVDKLINELSYYQERMHRKSKRRFREFLKGKAEEANLPYKINPNSFISKNVVIGDLKSAKYVLGAHYDTPPRMPAFLMRSVVFFNVFVIFAIVLLSALVIVFELPLIILIIAYFLSLLYIMGALGFANKYNYNDNTSGVIVLLYLMQVINCKDVAYVFFDNEEKGLFGSMQLASVLRRSKGYFPRRKVFINFDCVGVGNVFGIASLGSNEVAQKLIDLSDKELIKFEHRKPSIFEASDHFSFKNWNSIGIMCYNKKGKKYKLNNIHTHKDKFVEEDNIKTLAELIKKYIDKEEVAHG